MIEGPIQYCPHCGSSLIEKIHSGKLRPVCPHCKWVYFPDPKVAVAVLIKENDQILLVQRMFDPKKDHWTLPSGFVDAGEDPIQTAQRECFEETGLKIKNICLLDVIFSQEHPHGASILILYRAEVEAGQLKPGDDAKQATFFNIDQLPSLAFTSTQEILRAFI
jgi:ADP-ribose pyrophosphatase YjhB (NUDIX family)